MTLIDTPKSRAIAGRARALILHPRSEWEVIERETDSVRDLYTRYVMILAAVPPICTVLGAVIGSLFGSVHYSIVGAVVAALVDYALTLGMVYVLGLVIENLAPSFGGTKDRHQAMKVAAFFPTALWLAGVFALVPALSSLQVLGLYSLFILWLGLPRLMKVGEDKALVFTLAVILAALVAIIIVRAVAGAVNTSLI